MATFLKARWESDITAVLPRRDREGCEYEAYLPDPLGERAFVLDGPVAADVADAERAVHRLDAEARTLANTEALARLLLRAESVASSHIEGLEIGGRRLLRAEAAMHMGVPAEDVTAEEVLGNIEAMSWSVDTLSQTDALTVDGILEIHRRLMKGTRLREHAGVIREMQNWIGGSDYNPCSASFVPPPPEHVRSMLEDLCAFATGDELPAVAQAAIAHAQFETIHPFADGNGRTGRALIHVILRHRGLAKSVLTPVSLVLAARAKDYVAGLTATRYVGPPSSESAIDGLNQWIATFASACTGAVDEALEFEQRILDIQNKWRTVVGRIRSDSAVGLLIETLPGAPIVTVKSASELIGRSFERTNEAIGRLESAGVVRPMTVGRRNRLFEAPAVIDVFSEFAWILESAGDADLDEAAYSLAKLRERPS